MVGLGMSALVGILNACGGTPREEVAAPGTSVSAISEPSTQSAMRVYSPNETLDPSTFAPLGSPEALGGEVLEGTPALSGRIDFSDRGMTAGIFKATTGIVRIVFPFSEHATILEGEVTLTDEAGQSHTFKKGDSYFIRQGQIMLWEVKGEHVIKSFFNVTEQVTQ
jgi:hypothetical protein